MELLPPVMMNYKQIMIDQNKNVSKLVILAHKPAIDLDQWFSIRGPGPTRGPQQTFNSKYYIYSFILVL